MFNRLALFLAVLAWITAAQSVTASAQNRRNPFGLPDVSNPDGADVRRLAATAQLPGDNSDRNAGQWVPEAQPGNVNSLEGDWYSRWESGSAGLAKIRVIGDRLYAFYTDRSGRMAGRSWLLEALIENGTRLSGRWVQTRNSRDTGPFAGLIVNKERIDGVWSARPGDRWDFRRKLMEEASINAPSMPVMPAMPAMPPMPPGR